LTVVATFGMSNLLRICAVFISRTLSCLSSTPHTRRKEGRRREEKRKEKRSGEGRRRRGGGEERKGEGKVWK